MEMFVRSGFPFNYDAGEASFESGLECKDESLTLQSQAEDADINVIVKRFGVTGQLPQVRMPPTYGDFDSVDNYREALDLIREADRSFMLLPADVRARFKNDAGAFVDFAMDPANIEELRKMGLAVPKQEVSDGGEARGKEGATSEASGEDVAGGSGARK